MIHIRTMTSQDFPKADHMLAKLHDIHRKRRSDMFSGKHPYCREEYLQMLSDPGHIMLIAEMDEKAVGICFVTVYSRSGTTDRPRAYMDVLFVEPSMRRCGVAKSLFSEAEKRSIQAGAHRLDLSVWSFNEEALSFYRSMGMTEQRFILEKNL